MNTKENIGSNRRGFVATMAGLLSGLLLVRPTRLHAAVPDFKQFLHNVEIKALTTSKPKRHPAIAWQTDTDRTVLFWNGKGQMEPLFAMNHVGMVVWEGCDGKNTPRDISAILQKRYMVDPQRAFVDCLVFLAHLKNKGAIIL